MGILSHRQHIVLRKYGTCMNILTAQEYTKYTCMYVHVHVLKALKVYHSTANIRSSVHVRTYV